jgi:hypothetical protein
MAHSADRSSHHRRILLRSTTGVVPVQSDRPRTAIIHSLRADYIGLGALARLLRSAGRVAFQSTNAAHWKGSVVERYHRRCY